MAVWVELLSTGKARTDGQSDFERYCAALVPALCPYIAPAAEKGLLRFSEYRIHADTVIECQAAIAHTAIAHVEQLRASRQGATAGTLRCECPLFEIAGGAAAHPRRNLFERPHLLLMTLYASVGILIGRFWPGEQPESGQARPVPPTDLMAIRSSLPGKDQRFFTGAPQLEQDFIHALDDGRDVLAEHGSSRTRVLQGPVNVPWYEGLQEALNRASTAGRG